MSIDELYQLDKNQASIKKIDLFISSCVKLSSEHIKAICLKSLVLHNINKTNEALKLVYSLIPNIKDLEVEDIIELCNTIIEICLDINRFDQVEKYMALKKRYLPVSLQNQFLKDEINLALKQNDNTKAKNVIIEYLSDDLTKEEEIFAKNNLANIYYDSKEYSKFLEICHDLDDYYQTKMDYIKTTELFLKKINSYYYTNNYVRVIMEGNNHLKDSTLNDNLRLEIATKVILSYIACLDYKKASIIESDYEELLEKCDEAIALDFCKASLDLYTKTNSLVSIKTYQERVKKYSTNNDNQVKRRTKKLDYQIPIISEDVLEDATDDSVLNLDDNKSSVKTIKVEPKSTENVVVSENYIMLSNIFKTISESSLNNKFREIFRLAMIELVKKVNIKEAYILYYFNEYKGLQYKMERVYDKKLSFELIENTLNFEAYDKEIEVFLDEDSTYNINIVTSKVYEVTKYGISFPFYVDNKTIGSIAFFNDEKFLGEELVYEILKLFSSMLNVSLVNSIRQNKLEYENRKLYFLKDNLPFITKEHSNGFIHLITKDNFLNISSDIDESVFFSKIKSNDLIRYKKQLENVLESILESSVIEYSFLVDGEYIKVKEIMYPMYNDGTYTVLSIIENINEIEKEKKELTNLAYLDPVSKIDNEVKLMVDLKQEMTLKKFSLCIFKINNFDYYIDIYGYNFSNQLLYATAKFFKEYFKDDFNVKIYHLTGEMYAILISGVNDKRVIDSTLKLAFEAITSKLYVLNSRVKASFNCGVYRVGKNMSIKDSSSVFTYALDALGDILSMDHTLVNHYDSETHKQRFNQNQLVTHISEAIDHGKIGISYQQIVSITNKEVLGYYAKISLDSYEVDESYMSYVIEKRGLELDMLKYLISNTIKEQKEFLDKTRGRLLIFINITNNDNSLLEFINSNVTFFKYYQNNLVFIFDKVNKLASELKTIGYKIASRNVIDLLNNNLDYLFYSINDLDNEEELKDLTIKHNACLIVSDVNSKDNIETCITKNIENVYGKFYKKGLRINNLIDNVLKG